MEKKWQYNGRDYSIKKGNKQNEYILNGNVSTDECLSIVYDSIDDDLVELQRFAMKLAESFVNTPYIFDDDVVKQKKCYPKIKTGYYVAYLKKNAPTKHYYLGRRMFSRHIYKKYYLGRDFYINKDTINTLNMHFYNAQYIQELCDRKMCVIKLCGTVKNPRYIYQFGYYGYRY